jgi:uncharacterized protein (TIGR02117 family)
MAVVVTLAATLAGCASTPVEPYVGTAPTHRTLYVIASGWHTEIGIRTDVLSASLAELVAAVPSTRYIVFGWGQRTYYMTPDPGIGALLGAALPSPSVVLAIPLSEPPTAVFTTGSDVFALPVSQNGLDRLAQFIRDSIKQNPRGRPDRLGDGPYPGSTFYASTETYSVARTCNTWTAEALRVAGLPVRASGVIFAHQVVDQVRDLARHPH